LQRVGRTGRKREGHVHVLLSEGREEHNWAKAQDSYQEVQHSIIRGDQLELYNDVERLIPADAKPQCKEMIMEIEEYVRDKAKRKAACSPSNAASKKRKRNDDVDRNIPSGACTGFVSVKDLIVKGAKKRKKNGLADPDEQVVESDDTDREIEAGFNGPRRTVSAAATTIGKSKSKKASLKRSATAVDGAKHKQKKKKTPKETASVRLEDVTSSQFDRMAVDDSDDMEIERGLRLSSPERRQSGAGSSPSRSDVPLAQSVIEISSSAVPLAKSPQRLLSRSSSKSRRSSPIMNENSLAFSPVTPKTPVVSPKRPDCRSPLSIRKNPENVAWLLDDDDEPDLMIDIVSSSPQTGCAQVRTAQEIEIVEDSEVEFVDDDLGEGDSRCRSNEVIPIGSSPLASSPSESRPAKFLGRFPARAPMPSTKLMPPPPAPVRPAISVPGPSFPVRPVGYQAKKRSTALNSSPLASIPPRARRLHHLRSSSPGASDLPQPPPPRKKSKRRPDTRLIHRLIDTEAVHSGDEVSAGSSTCSSHEDEESESDRQFLKDVPDTQAPSPSSYDQTLMYRQSLMSQAPPGAPVFARAAAVVRGRRFGVDSLTPPHALLHKTSVMSSSPRRGDEEPDEYLMGSFVVDDDAELSYLNSSCSES
jgi:ATP-dependent DNA helicase MPH1